MIGLVVLGGMAAWPHLRRYTARWRNHLLLVLATVGVSAVFAAPVEPERFGLLFIAGPWFFLGLQELLRYLPAFVAGVVIPLAPVVLLFWLPADGSARRYGIVAILLWLFAYTVLTLLCLQRL